jgi:hypothetical protein
MSRKWRRWELSIKKQLCSVSQDSYKTLASWDYQMWKIGLTVAGSVTNLNWKLVFDGIDADTQFVGCYEPVEERGVHLISHLSITHTMGSCGDRN